MQSSIFAIFCCSKNGRKSLKLYKIHHYDIMTPVKFGGDSVIFDRDMKS